LSVATHPFGVAVEARDEEAALETIADEVVFRSPAVHKPYHGREQVDALLRLVATVFEDFRYTNEWRDGRTTILFFEAHVGDRELQGVDILEENDEGKIAQLTVLIRPLSGLQAVANAMAAKLGLA
jgi:SnoaL-like protein